MYGQGKTPEQVLACLRGLAEAHPDRAILGTRLDAAAIALLGQVGRVGQVGQDEPRFDVDELSRTVIVGPLPKAVGTVGVVSAGTADSSVAREAARTVAVHGARPVEFADVGVAGLHRVLSVADRLAECDALIVVAGMEGALPSVVGGLVGVPLVAVPTSTGYGTGADGLAAVLAMLNSCAPGIAVVNIDNGYGAGVHAARIARAAGGARPTSATSPTNTASPANTAGPANTASPAAAPGDSGVPQ